jgi:hypothetical protein
MGDRNNDFVYFFDLEPEAISKNTLRKNLEKWKIAKLNKWIIDRGNNPYPTEKQKMDLATKLNLTKKQVNNWFINIRKVGRSVFD